MKFIPYIFYLYVLAFYNTVLSDLFSIYGVNLDLPLLMVTIIALYRTETTALWFAIGVAVISAIQRLDMMPWEILALGGIAVVANQVSLRMNLESIASRLIVLAVFLLIHNVFITLVMSFDNFPFVLYRYILPGTIYTMFLGWLVFLFKDGLFSLRKVKALS
jgi:hypothetical protein